MREPHIVPSFDHLFFATIFVRWTYTLRDDVINLRLLHDSCFQFGRLLHFVGASLDLIFRVKNVRPGE